MQEELKIQFMSPEEYRRQLAGLIDQDAIAEKSDRESQRTRIREIAIRFASLLPRLVGEQIDRKTMWARLATAIESAAAKTPGGDFELFCQHVLEHIVAEPGKVSENSDLHELLSIVREWPQADREALLEYCQTRLLTVLSFARNNWVNRPKNTTKEGANT